MAGDLAELRALIDADTGGFMRGMDQVDRRMGQTQQKMSGVGRAGLAMGRVAKVGALALGGGMLIGGAAVAKIGLSMSMLKQNAQIAFTTMTGSGAKATKMMADLQKFAATTPFEFRELIPAAQRLMAMGFAAKDVVPILTDVGNAAAGLGIGTEGVNRITLALGQMSAKGHVAGGELMQLTEAGVPAIRYLAKAFHVSTSEMSDMVEKGLVPADKGIKAIRDGMRGDFGGLMEKQSKTLAGAVSNIKDSFTAIASGLTDLFVPALTKGALRFSGFLAKLQRPLDVSGRKVSVKMAAKIIWEDVEPMLKDAADSLWGSMKSGLQSAFDAVAGSDQMTLSPLKGVQGFGGQTVIPFKPVFQVQDQDSKGVLTTWFQNNVQPVIDDWNSKGNEGGRSFFQRMRQGAAAEVPLMAKGFADMMLTGPLQALDGIMRGDARRIGQGFMTTLGGAFRASGLGVVKDALMAVIGNDLRNALGTMGSLIAHGAGTIAGRAAQLGRGIVTGIITGTGNLASAVWGAVRSKIDSVSSHSVAGTFKKMGGTIITGIVSGLTGLATRVWGAISGALSGIHGHISLPVPHIDIGHLSGPGGISIPYPSGLSFASGTMTTRAQMALIGEKGREYVIPVTGSNRARGLALWKKAGRDLGVPGMAAGGVTGGTFQRIPPDPSFRRGMTLQQMQQVLGDYEANTSRFRDAYALSGGVTTPAESAALARRIGVEQGMIATIINRRRTLARALATARRRLRHAKTKKGRASIRKQIKGLQAQLGAVSEHDLAQSGYDLENDRQQYLADARARPAPPEPEDTSPADSGGVRGVDPGAGVFEGSGGGGGGLSGGGGGGGGGPTYITIDMRGAVVTVDDFVSQVREKLAAYGKSNGSIFGNVQADTVPR